jgi:hypothetical protein
VDNNATEGYSGIKLCPHYKLKFVSLKPKLIDDLGKLNLTFEHIIYTYWNQGEPGKSLSEVHTHLPSVLQTSDRPSVKVIQIPLEIPGLSPSLYGPCCLSPEVAYGVIAFDGRFIGYLLRKEDALALDRMVLELERSQCISPSFMMWMETKPRWKLPETFIGDFPSACLYYLRS